MSFFVLLRRFVPAILFFISSPGEAKVKDDLPGEIDKANP